MYWVSLVCLEFNNFYIVIFYEDNIKFKGGEQITIQGTNFPSALTKVYIGQTSVNIISSSNSQIVIQSPVLAPGSYQLIIPAGSIGNAK